MKRIRPALRLARRWLALAFDGMLAVIALWGLFALIGLALLVALAFIWALASALR